MKYDSSITYHLKAMANVKDFADKRTNRRTKDGPKTTCLRSIDAGGGGHKNSFHTITTVITCYTCRYYHDNVSALPSNTTKPGSDYHYKRAMNYS